MTALNKRIYRLLHNNLLSKGKSCLSWRVWEWTVRELIGHANRALLTVETYLEQPSESTEWSDPSRGCDQSWRTSGNSSSANCWST